MAKLFYAAVAIIAVLVSSATAENCTPGLNICGAGLLVKGNYHDQIVEALRDAGQPTDDDHINKSLFNCIGGDNGDIQFIDYCTKCNDGGSGNSDTCEGGGSGKCKTTLAYCGSSLIEKDDSFKDAVANELKSNNQQTGDDDIKNGLFLCKGGDKDNEGIQWLLNCGKSSSGGSCVNGGDGKSDFCKDK